MNTSNSTTSFKQCSECGITFPLTSEYWYKHSHYKDGFRNQCKICVNFDNEKRRRENPEKYREMSRRSQEKKKALKTLKQYKPKREPLFSDDTVIIFLTKEQQTVIDTVDADLAQFNWTSAKAKTGYTAYRNTPNHPEIKIYLHRVILERILERELLPFPDEQVDHVDRNPLNNTRSNLRLANNIENNRNKLEYKHNTSGHRGVSWDKSRNKWASHITVNRKHIYLGRFDDFNDAVKARLDAEILYFGEFAPKSR